MSDPALSDDEIRTVTSLLQKLEPGLLPFPVFHQVARLVTLPIVEVVPLRQKDGKLEILLLKRTADDPVWPSQEHVPGTVIRATDRLATALDRVLNDELPGAETTKPQFARNIVHHSGRGMESSQVYWVEVTNEPAIGTFYDTANLPVSLVTSQLDFIPSVIEIYKRSHNLSQ